MGQISKLAEEMQAQFTRAKRANGDEFYKLKDGAPEWMTDVCCAAHDSATILPDDHRYEYIADAVDKLAEVERDRDADDAADQLEPDCYNNDLLAWVSSRLSRMSYVDDAIEAGCSTLAEALACGQLEERREVFSQVLDALRERAEELDAEDEEDEESDEEEMTDAS